MSGSWIFVYYVNIYILEDMGSPGGRVMSGSWIFVYYGNIYIFEDMGSPTLFCCCCLLVLNTK